MIKIIPTFPGWLNITMSPNHCQSRHKWLTGHLIYFRKQRGFFLKSYDRHIYFASFSDLGSTQTTGNSKTPPWLARRKLKVMLWSGSSGAKDLRPPCCASKAELILLMTSIEVNDRLQNMFSNWMTLTVGKVAWSIHMGNRYHRTNPLSN